jgi:hypothetical protein
MEVLGLVKSQQEIIKILTDHSEKSRQEEKIELENVHFDKYGLSCVFKYYKGFKILFQFELYLDHRFHEQLQSFVESIKLCKEDNIIIRSRPAYSAVWKTNEQGEISFGSSAMIDIYMPSNLCVNHFIYLQNLIKGNSNWYTVPTAMRNSKEEICLYWKDDAFSIGYQFIYSLGTRKLYEFAFEVAHDSEMNKFSDFVNNVKQHIECEFNGRFQDTNYQIELKNDLIRYSCSESGYDNFICYIPMELCLKHFLTIGKSLNHQAD